MHSRLSQAALGSLLLALLACSGGGNSTAPNPDVPSATAPVFDPGNSKIPLPNILATAVAPDPLTGAYTSHTTGATVVGARPANTSMTPPEALAYVNKYEMGSTNAVSGVNAPVYMQFTAPVDATTVTAANVKVFQLTPDAAGTENGALGFTDVSAMFSYHYVAGGTDLFLYPNFPLLPGTRYLYLVTSRVKDTAGKPIAASPYFDLLKSPTPLTGSLAQLEQIRGDFLLNNAAAQNNLTNPILLRGYYKTMSDLVAATATTTVTKLGDITLLGRFITTGAGVMSLTTTSPSATGASRIPVESALRAFAFGSDNGLPGGLLAAKAWDNTVTTSATFTAANNGNADPAVAATGTNAYWGAVLTAAHLTVTPAPATVGTVILGTFNSADLSIDPVVAKANAATMDLTAVTGAWNPAAGVVQAFRPDGLHAFGFYHTNRTVHFVYVAPATGSNWPLVIFQHGITDQKESIIAVAQTLTAMGRAVIAIDLPLHGELQFPGHTTGAAWGQDFMAVGAPLATRTNIQQAALNLTRLEYLIRTNNTGFGAATPSISDIKFLGHSLGSIVGAYYLASNTTLDSNPAHLPYTQDSLNLNMKGYLSVPGARTAYLIQNSPTFGPSVDAGLAAQGIAKNTPTYHQFFQVTQSVVDPIDPATITTPLYGIASGAPVDGPSRLSGRITIQESTTSTYSATLGSDGLPIPTNGDLVIGNAYTRYFASALGGRGVLGTAGAAVAPDFLQLGYVALGATVAPHADGVVGTPFLFELEGAALTPKVGSAAITATASSPEQGYFQFDQASIKHSSILDPTANALNTYLIQTQMGYFLAGKGAVVDPTHFAPPAPAMIVGTPVKDVQVPPAYKILGRN